MQAGRSDRDDQPQFEVSEAGRAIRTARVANSAVGKLVLPFSRSTTEKGNGWRLVGFSLQQSPSSAPVCPGMPAQHQLLSPHWLTSVKPPNLPETRLAGTEAYGSESIHTLIAEG